LQCSLTFVSLFLRSRGRRNRSAFAREGAHEHDDDTSPIKAGAVALTTRGTRSRAVATKTTATLTTSTSRMPPCCCSPPSKGHRFAVMEIEFDFLARTCRRVTSRELLKDARMLRRESSVVNSHVHDALPRPLDRPAVPRRGSRRCSRRCQASIGSTPP
jgi:hypothetical protein